MKASFALADFPSNLCEMLRIKLDLCQLSLLLSDESFSEALLLCQALSICFTLSCNLLSSCNPLTVTFDGHLLFGALSIHLLQSCLRFKELTAERLSFSFSCSSWLLPRHSSCEGLYCPLGFFDFVSYSVVLFQELVVLCFLFLENLEFGINLGLDFINEPKTFFRDSC